MTTLTNNLVSYYKLDGNSNDATALPPINNGSPNNGTDTNIIYEAGTGIMNQDFEGYSLGVLSGQDGWAGSSPAYFNVENSVSHSGTQAVSNSTIGDYVIEKQGNATTDGAVTVWLKGNMNSADFYVVQTSGNVHVCLLNFGTSFNGIQYNNGSGWVTLYGTWDTSVWHELDVQWRISDGKVRYQFDNGGWTIWDTPNTNGWTVADKYSFESGNSGAGQTFYFDDISSAGGKINQGVNFDGVNSKIDLGTGLDFAGTNAISISMWVKFPRDNTSTYLFFALMKNFQAYIRTSNTDNTYYWIVAGSNLVGNTALTKNVWQHIVATYDGANVRVYLNGSADGSAAQTGNMADVATRHATLGYSYGTAPYYTGLLDEVGIWSRALTSQEVMALYNFGNGLQYPFPNQNSMFLTF